MAVKLYQEYSVRFASKVETYKAGPVQQRSCNDICCVLFFFLILVATIGGGAYFMYNGREAYAKIINSTDSIDKEQFQRSFVKILIKIVPFVVGMLVLSCALSVLYILLAKSFPKCLTYSLIGLTFLIYIALIIVGIVVKVYALSGVAAVILLLNAVILWCFWGYISIGITLLSCAGRFLTEKPAVYFIALISLFLNSLYTLFWIFSWVGVYSNQQVNNDSSVLQIVYYIWYADAIFFGYFLYYCMVFLVAMACAFWYYQNQENSVMRGFSYIKYHLGSITFASVVITIITLMRMMANDTESQNGIIRIIACIIQCILACIEELLKVLNHNAVIVMAVTGESYIDSAKSAIGLIFDNIGLFVIVDFFATFMELYASIVCVIIPAVIGGFGIYLTENNGPESENAITYAVVGGVFILLLALLISNVVIGMLEEALSCIFIFYSYDCKLRSMGIPINNIPEEIKEQLDQAAGNPATNQATQAYLAQ